MRHLGWGLVSHSPSRAALQPSAASVGWQARADLQLKRASCGHSLIDAGKQTGSLGAQGGRPAAQ